MSDIREHMLSAWTANLLQNADNKTDYSSFFDVVRQDQLLQKQGSGVQDIVSHINRCLNSVKTRIEGLCLLEITLQQCSTEVFLNNAATWARMLLQTLQSYDPAANQKVCCRVTAELLRHSAPFSELHHDLATSTVPLIISTLISAKEQWQAAAIQCITACVLCYPGPCGPQKNKIEDIIVPCLESEEGLIKQAAVNCYALLPRCGGGGNQGVKHTEAFSAQLDKVLCSLHSTLDALYKDQETDTESYTRPAEESSLYFPELGNNQPDRYCHLQARFSTLCTVLQQMLNQDFPAVAKLPLQDLMSVACRTLALTPKQLLLRPTQERIYLASLVPFLHKDILQLLSFLITSVGSHLVPYSPVVNKLFVQTLNWSLTSNTLYGQDRPYCEVRTQVYNSLSTWLTELGCASGVENVADSIVQHAVSDSKAAVDSVKPQSSMLATTSKSSLPPAVGKKKKKKHGLGDIGQISAQRKLDYGANKEVCQAALDVLKKLLIAAGPFLKPGHHKAIQEFCIPLLLRMDQHSSMANPIPYADSSCRGALYDLLLTSVTSPHPKWPPATQCAVTAFQRGRLDENTEVSTLCKEALTLCENIIHPRAPTLNTPLEIEPTTLSLENGVTQDVIVPQTITIAIPREKRKTEGGDTLPVKVARVQMDLSDSVNEEMEVQTVNSSSSDDDDDDDDNDVAAADNDDDAEVDEERDADEKDVNISTDNTLPSTSREGIGASSKGKVSRGNRSDKEEEEEEETGTKQTIDLTKETPEKNTTTTTRQETSLATEEKSGENLDASKDGEDIAEVVDEAEESADKEEVAEKEVKGINDKDDSTNVEMMLKDFVDAGPDSD